MSIIGPRPALWNQEDLIEQRDLYGANSVTPGLTGLAQIKGRDKLEITDKAKLDGEYVSVLRTGGLKALLQDVKCFIGTIVCVLKRDGIIEGGTGIEKENGSISMDIDKVDRDECTNVELEDYGHKKSFRIDKLAKKRVLITGANSYIGRSFVSYASKHYPTLEIDTIDMIDGSWRRSDFSVYDTVFHVAGIAHSDVGNINEKEKTDIMLLIKI